MNQMKQINRSVAPATVGLLERKAMATDTDVAGIPAATGTTAKDSGEIECYTVLWYCPVKGCNYHLWALPEEAEGIPFLMVHHFIKDHGMRPAGIIEYDPILASEVRDYCAAMGMGPPAEFRTGVPTKMGAAEVRT